MRLLLLLLVLVSTGCASLTSQIMKATAERPALEVDYSIPQGATMAWAYSDLKGQLESGGVIVMEVVDLHDSRGRKVFGLTTANRKHIFIEATIEPNAQFEILTHEAGHLFHTGAASLAEAELVAQLVSAHLQVHYGLRRDAVVRSVSGYLVGYKYALALAPHLRADIELAMQVLTGKRKWRVE